jgi:hypothetical protein
MDAYYFVWVMTPLGPRPQVWHSDCFEVARFRLRNLIERHKLPAGKEAVSLDALAALYPLVAAA